MTDLRPTVGLAVGRRVDAVIMVKRSARTELYFHFDDDTYLEIYGNFQCSSYLRQAPLAVLRMDFHPGEEFVEHSTDANDGAA